MIEDIMLSLCFNTYMRKCVHAYHTHAKKIRIMCYKCTHSKHQHNLCISKETRLISNLIILLLSQGKNFKDTEMFHLYPFLCFL